MSSNNNSKSNMDPKSIRSAAQVGSSAAAGPLFASSSAGAVKSQSFATLGGAGRGPDGTHAVKSSHRSSGGALGSERSDSRTTSGNGTPIIYNNVYSVNAKPGHIDIKLSTTGSVQSIIASNYDYPPSPPAVDEQVSSKPLTIANLAALPSSFSSTIATSPTSDADSSELSFSTSSSSEVPSIASSIDETKFLSSIFGSTYLSEFSKNGVKVVALPQDVAEDSALPFDSAAILTSSAHDTKTLYYLASTSDSNNKLDREGLVDLMELAEEDLDCNGIVICLNRKEDKENLAETLHSLMYVGGAIVAPNSGLVGFNSEDYILVGLDL